MRVRLFDIEKGKAKITPQVKSIHYLNKIIEKYGEENALKLFQIFDKVYDLNPETNPYATVEEKVKYETVLRSMYPDIEDSVDMDDELIEQALDLVEELYATPKYRAFKSLKILYERISEKIRFGEVYIDKDNGNMGEITKATTALESLNKKLSEAYKELEEEMNTKQVRGGVKARTRPQTELN